MALPVVGVRIAAAGSRSCPQGAAGRCSGWVAYRSCPAAYGWYPGAAYLRVLTATSHTGEAG